MPGSRVKEVRMNLPTILKAAPQLGKDYEFLLPVAPTLDRSFLESLILRNTTSHSSPNPSPHSGTPAQASSPAEPQQSKPP